MNTEYNESYCLAILINNLKRRRRYPDAIVVADCAKHLCDLYGSSNKVAQLVGVVPSVISKWVKLAEAPKILRSLVKQGKIYPIASFAILSAFSDDTKISEFAQEVSGWGEPEIIRLIKYIKENPNLSVAMCKELLIAETLKAMVENQDQYEEGNNRKAR